MCNKSDYHPGGGWRVPRAMVALLAAMLAALGAGPLLAQPANDNFTNATTLLPVNVGTVAGSNVGATSEAGEPVDAGTGGGKTVWYVWTAPFTGTISFNTEGSSFDTDLSAYTGTNVAGLNLIAANDDVNYPVDLTSLVTFPVITGTSYYLQVDGFLGDSGNVVLSWRPSGALAAGNFVIALPATPTVPAGGTPFHPASVPVYNISEYDVSGDPAAKVVVTRVSGSSGRVKVNYVVTNSFYTDILQTNIYGTNLYVTNYDTNMVPLSYSNLLVTNFYTTNLIQSYASSVGLFTCTEVSGNQLASGIQVVATNAGPLGSTVGPTISNITYTAGVVSNAFFPCLNYTGSNTVTNGSIITVTYSNVFCTNVVVVTNVPSAIPGLDYLPTSGTLVFNDYEMAKNLPLDILGDTAATQNGLVLVSLTGASLDANEDTNELAPPTLDAVGSNALVVLNCPNIAVVNQPPIPNCTNAGVIFNFGLTVRQLPDNSVTWLGECTVYRTGTDIGEGCSVNYTIGGNPANPNSSSDSYLLQPGSDFANPNPPNPNIVSSQLPDFQAATGTLTWAAFDAAPKSFNVTIIQNTNVKFNEDINITLSGPQPADAYLGENSRMTVTILFDNQPAGALDRNHNEDNSPTTDPAYNHEPGANNPVYAAVVQPDNKTVFAGEFNAYDTVPRNAIARMNADGSLDTGFLASPNSGADGLITCLALETNGDIYIGGEFDSFNGTNRYSVGRLNPDGSLDLTFNPGVGVNSSNGPGTVSAMQLQPDGKLLIAGDFISVNTTNRNNIARLNPDGSLDTSFDPGVGPSDIINAIALQANGQILIGGNFTSVDGTNLNYIARLNSDGTLDTAFNPGTGPDGSVYAIAVQTNGQILIGGAFHNINLIANNSIARLNANGSLDLGFYNGTGADDVVNVITLQADGNILIGGQFENYNQTRRVGLARLLTSGALDTSFLDTAYDQFAGLVRDYHNQSYQPKNYLQTIAVQADGNIIIGGQFYQLGGETNRDQGIWARDGIAPRLNIARLIGRSTPGPGNISLAYGSYTADKFGGSSYVSILRTNGALGPASVTFTPISESAGPGSAVAGSDYTQTPYYPVWTTTWPGGGGYASWDFADSYIGLNNSSTDDLGLRPLADVSTANVYVNVLNNTNSTGNLALDVGISQPQSSDIFFLGGENIPLGVALGSNTAAPMTIVGNTLQNGVLGFSSAVYSVNESATNAVITVTRTNGSTGSVTVWAFTVPGGTAVPGPANNYISVSNKLTFINGQSQTFNVPIVDNHVYGPDKTVDLVLIDPTGGATLGQNTTVLTIVNDNFAPGHLNFTSTNFSAHEDSGSAAISVSRTGGSQGTLSVSAISSDATATNGLNYGAATNVLSWIAGDVSNKTFSVPLIHDGLVTSNLIVKLRLTNSVVAGSNNNLALGLTTNATLTIINDDFFGSPTFSTPTYTVNNNGGFVTITVNRLGGSAQTITVNYTTVDGTGANAAFAGVDYTAISGTLTFTPGVFSQAFNVPITPKSSPVGNLAFGVVLSGPTPTSGPGGGVTLGNPSTASVTIIDALTYDEPPGGVDSLFSAASFNGTVYSLALQTNGQIVAGGDFTFADGTPRNRIARLNSDGTIDPKFSSPTDGVDASIRAMAVQTDGGIVVGGLFSEINGVNRQYIGRLNYDGAVDTTFNPGAGADNPVYAVAETFSGAPTNASNRRILVGGSFTSIAGATNNCIAQLLNNGNVDPNFSPIGANATVYAVAVYSTNDTVNGGRILIGGDFTNVDGVIRNHIARLNADGSLDATFNPGAGPNDSVRAIAIQVDGGIVIGGLFTSVGSSSLSHIARLNPNGQVDALFNPGPGANDAVTCIAIQEDHRILIGGDFTTANGVTRNRLSRLNSDGSVDPSINFGAGADSFVSTIVIQPDDEMVVGGGFTHFNNISAPYIARLFGRNNAGTGSLQFTEGNYSVIENVTNVVIGVERVGGTAGSASVVFSTSDGTAASGSNYLGVTNTLTFPNGETFQNVNIPIFSNNIVDINRTVNLALSNVVGASLGGQPTALLTIINDNSGVSFSSPNFTVIKNAINGAGILTLQRSGSSIGPASVDFFTTTNGTGVLGTDYNAASNTVFFLDGQTTATATVPVINNGIPEGNRTVGVMLTNPTNTILISPFVATLTIVDNNQPTGQLMFSAPSYSALETSTNAVITVVRTNGTSGTLSVQYATSDGTATAGSNYRPTNGSLTFEDNGVTSQSFTVPLLYNPLVQGDLTVNLTLSNPSTNTQIIGPNPVPLTIMDANFGVAFAESAYFVNDTNGLLTVGVQRVGNTNGAFTVKYATADGTATNGVDYTATNGTLSFASGETFATFNIAVLRNPAVTGNRIFLVNLSSPSSPAQLATPGTASVTVVDTDVGLSFSSATNGVNKSAPNVLVSVVRTGSVSGIISVNYSTADGTATGYTNYIPTNGVLSFADGQISNSFLVTIIDDNRVDPNLTFTNLLINPVMGPGAFETPQLLYPSNQTVTITNDLAGLSFSNPAYSVAENGVSATITVVRTGYTSNPLSVNFATANGTAVAGSQYLGTNGTLIFTNGQVSATFNVPIIDKNVTGGSETVLLSLSTPSTGSTLVNPSAATLTILNNDGSLIVPAGAALIGGSANGAISPGATVTMLLALRNEAGTNTVNLMATLLPTNGIASPSPSTPVSYGVLVTNGPSVFRPFTFTASGTNGSHIIATLQWQDGTNLGTAAFTFTVGTSTNSFTNNSVIVINDDAPANPYPSVVNVSGVVGSISKVTATLSGLSHGRISDVGILLVGPTGTNTLLMAGDGGADNVSGLNLTFDDTGAAFPNPAPASGTFTYRPTAAFSPAFPASTNGPGLLPAPFGATLSGFTNSNPNGAWLLYVVDDVVLNSGVIENGWSLTITSLGVLSPTVDLVAGLTAAPNPAVVSSNYTYTITVTNAGPSPATGVSVSDVLPANVTEVSNTTTQGAWTNNSGTWVLNVGSLATNGTATATLTVNCSVATLVTNSITASANETDANTANNTASVVTTVSSPSADLVVSLTGSPDPLLLGNNLTYSITVTNLGPATAPNVMVTNFLPAGVIYVTNVPAGIATNFAGTVVGSLGSLGSGTSGSFSIIVTPLVAGTITDSVNVISSVPTPLKANGQASVKILVEAVQLGINSAGQSLTFTWPTFGSNYTLEYATSLNPPVTWTTVTSPQPQLIGGQESVTLTNSGGTRYFRLIGAGQ